MEFCFSGKITLEDFIQFNKVHIRNSRFWFIKYIVYLLCIVYILSFTIIPFIRDYMEYNILREIIFDIYFIKIILIFFSLIVFFVILDKIISPTINKRIYKKYYNSNKFYNELVNCKINENEIIINSESGNSILTKDKILKIIYYKDAIYIYFGLNITYIICARYFESISQFNELCNLLKEKYYKK